VVERDRKLQIPAFVWAFVFVFGFAAGEGRTLADFRRCYNSTADKMLSPGGFYQRLTPTLAEYFSDLVEAALDEVAVPDSVDVDVERFRDVMIADGTILRLHELLSEKYKSRYEEQAGAKLHLLQNATEKTIERFERSRTRNPRQYYVQDRVVAARTAHTLRFGVFQIPPVCVNRRE